MYQISRSIYRELAPHVIGNADHALANRQRVLQASEATITRLAMDGRYFAHPTRSLFDEVRSCFALSDQVFVYRVIARYIALTGTYLSQLPDNVTPFGERRECHASTRRGSPCQREPLPGKQYCPSHKHLEEPVPARPLLFRQPANDGAGVRQEEVSSAMISVAG